VDHKPLYKFQMHPVDDKLVLPSAMFCMTVMLELLMLRWFNVTTDILSFFLCWMHYSVITIKYEVLALWIFLYSVLSNMKLFSAVICKNNLHFVVHFMGVMMDNSAKLALPNLLCPILLSHKFVIVISSLWLHFFLLLFYLHNLCFVKGWNKLYFLLCHHILSEIGH
jgi:hypothetical protein